MNKKLKKVHWEMGQMLLPHHLIAQEQALMGLVWHTLEQMGLPLYGFSRVTWEENLLEQGVLHLQSVTARFPSGELIDLPENVFLEKNLDLNKEGKNQLAVYLHLMQEKRQIEQTMTVKENSAPIFLSCCQITLSPQREIDGSVDILKLAEFKKTPENIWMLDEGYIPPLLNTSCSTFLEKKFSRIRDILENVEKRIAQELTGPEFFAHQRQEAKLCLLQIGKLQRFFANLTSHIVPHPYFFYEDLCRLLDVVKMEHSYPLLPYQHEALGPLLTSLIHQMEKMLIYEHKGFNCLQFEKKDGMYVIESLSPNLSQAKEIYFVIQKSDTHQAFALKGSKLTSRARVSQVRQFSLAGIPLLSIKTPSFFNAGFSNESEVYTVEKEEEWKKAIEEGNLVFFNQEFSFPLQIFLYWRGYC